jgi:SAM-dependent methyltransferase
VAQVTSGIRSILSHPFVYGAFQNIMGAQRGRARFVRDCVRPFPGMRVLDLGCGPAEVLSSMPDDIDYVGYDMSADYIAAAQRRFANRGEFHCRLLEKAEVATLEPFDLVMGIGVRAHSHAGSLPRGRSEPACALPDCTRPRPACAERRGLPCPGGWSRTRSRGQGDAPGVDSVHALGHGMSRLTLAVQARRPARGLSR